MVHREGDLDVIGVGLAEAVDEHGNVVEAYPARARPARLKEGDEWRRVR